MFERSNSEMLRMRHIPQTISVWKLAGDAALWMTVSFSADNDVETAKLLLQLFHSAVHRS